MTSGIGRRAGAYIIDYFIISILILIVTIFIPVTVKETEYSKDIISKTTEFAKGEITLSEYYTDYQEIAYNLAKIDFPVSIANVVIILIYFVIIPYFQNGQTFGKKILKIKVIKEKGKLTINDLIVRTVINEKLLTLLVALGAVYLTQAGLYNTIVSSLNIVQGGLIIASIGMIIFRKDKLGLQDMITKTRVVREDISRWEN